MLKPFVPALAAVLLAAPAGAFAATTIDFESAPSVFTSYTTGGVTFTAVDGGAIVAVSNPNGTIGLLSNAYPDPFSTLRGDIAGGANLVSVDLGDFGADEDLVFLAAYDASNTLLAYADALLGESFTGMFTVSVTSSALIDHVIFGSTFPSGSGSSVYADNFSYDVRGPVPEPQTWALLIAGFGLAGAALRGRRALA